MHTDYDLLVEEVVGKLWKGKPAQPCLDLIAAREYIPGAKETCRILKEKGYTLALISASSIHLARRAQDELGIDHIFANELVIQDGKIAGTFIWPIGAGYEKKAEIVRDLCTRLHIPPKASIYVGDSETDYAAFHIVGISIAFNTSSEKLKTAATYVINAENLNTILPYLP